MPLPSPTVADFEPKAYDPIHGVVTLMRRLLPSETYLNDGGTPQLPTALAASGGPCCVYPSYGLNLAQVKSSTTVTYSTSRKFIYIG